MVREAYPIMAGSSLIPVGVRTGLKVTGYDKPIISPHKATYSLLAEGLIAVVGSVTTFLVKRPALKALGAGAGISGIVATINDIVDLYAIPAPPAPPVAPIPTVTAAAATPATVAASAYVATKAPAVVAPAPTPAVTPTVAMPAGAPAPWVAQGLSPAMITAALKLYPTATNRSLTTLEVMAVAGAK